MFNFIGTRNRKKLTLIEISELWLELKKFSVKLSTYCNYKQKLEDYIYSQLGSLKYSEISQTQLNDFIDYLFVRNGIFYLIQQSHHFLIIAGHVFPQIQIPIAVLIGNIDISDFLYDQP